MDIKDVQPDQMLMSKEEADKYTINRNRHEWLTGGELHLPLDSISGRIGARAYAYSLIAEGREAEGEAVLDLVGEEG